MPDLDAKIREDLELTCWDFGTAEMLANERADALRDVLDHLEHLEIRTTDDPFPLSPHAVKVVADGIRGRIARALGVTE